MSKTITYKITFTNKAMAALFLWELHEWQISPSKYSLNTQKWYFYHCSADVIDVFTETFAPEAAKIEKEQK